jgi:hypothetical protein
MRPKNGVYEYIAVYVDDLAIAVADPQEFVDVLEKKHKFKLKETGTIAFHLGCEFFRDDEGILCMAPKEYIEKMMMGTNKCLEKSCRLMFTFHLRKVTILSWIPRNYLTRLECSSTNRLLGLYNGFFCLDALSLSSFQALPFQGHLEQD